MKAEEILRTLVANGAQLTTGPDGSLSVSPRSALTPELRAALQTQKEAVVQLLHRESFDDPRSAVRRLEKTLDAEKADFDCFCLVVCDKATPPPPDLSQRICAEARRRGLTGFHLLIARAPGYDPWKGEFQK